MHTSLAVAGEDMSVSVDSNSPQGDDVGKILAKIQEDLQYLRVAASRVVDGEIDPQSLELVLARTERGVQTVAERVVHSNNSQVVTLPAVTGRRRGSGRGQQGERTMEELVSGAQRRSQIKQARTSQSKHLSGLSPGQQAQVDHMSQLVSRPTHPLTRDVLTSHYQLSGYHGNNTTRAGFKSVPGQLQVGSTVKPLTTLPRANKRDTQLTPPSISQEDASKGLLSLLERGLIPPAADIVLSPPPVQPRPVQLHNSTEQHHRVKIAEGTSTHLTGVKLDLSGVAEESIAGKAIFVPAVERSSTQSMSKHSTSVSVKTLEAPSIVQRPQTPPTTAVDHTHKETSASYKVIVQNGCVVDGVKEFTSFKRAYRHRWTSIHAVLHSAEELCRNYSIPLAILDGDRILSVASEYELGLRVSKHHVLDCLSNYEEVERILAIPGRRYKGSRGLQAAASKIQATFRMYVKRRQYLDYRRKKWAAGILSMSWVMFVKLYRVREQLREARATQLTNYRSRAKALRRRWQQITSSKRTIVHIPSQGHPQPVRAKVDDFRVKQNMQMSRMFDLRDPNVDVIYISPVEIDQEVLDYYHKMLAMGPAGDTARERLHIITPEAVRHFHGHNMALSTLLMYSPKSLSRVKNLVAGREAYIVSGVVNRDDITIADKLGLPLLGSEPEVTQLYSTKSGSKKIFANAGLSMPYSAGDIFSEEQLIEKLASLVASHPLVPRWLFKLPEHIRGRGFAYCDVPQHLQCHQWLLRESERYGKKWTKKWAQEQALKRILAELPYVLSTQAHPVDKDLFPTWRDFLEMFLNHGGLIEGVPPSDSVTALSVDILIEPTGAVNILTTQDQICARPYEVWGVSIPQASIDPAHLAEKATMVGEACRARGIIGYLSVDFVTFIDPKELTQVLWAVDLDLGYSDHLALYQLLTYVTGAEMKPDTGRLELPNEESRYAVLAPHLMHTNLTLIYYSIFFQMCKAHFIGYDPNEKLGTLFALIDAQHKEHLGMICLQESLSKAVTSCSSNLSTIHQEISTPHMQGTSNFKLATKELDDISVLMVSNDSEDVQGESN